MKPQELAGQYELARGTAVGKYEILRKLATGGMAEIYLARSTGTAGFEKLVVLKRILPHVASDPTFVQMFLDEARLAATLHHPNIADVYDVGEAEGTYFYAMEFVHGQDVRTIRLSTRQRNEQVPMAIALAIIHGGASALDYAHEKTTNDGKPLNLVHRDVSASNVMVSYDGAIKLLDFGIARASTSTHKTQTGTLKGKIPYMSPEQCKGLPMDRRSDLFSLGVVLYELTVGRRPFRGETDFAVMDQIVYQGAQAPATLVKGYPEQLDAIVMKLLDRTPGNRYATGGELIAALEEFIGNNGLWVSSRPLGKYMKTLFADKIDAWERAEQEGLTLGQHVADSITSQSQQLNLMTPPTGFPGIPPRPSQAMEAQRLSQAMEAVAPPFPTATPHSMEAVAPPRSAVMDAVSPPRSAPMAAAAPRSAPQAIQDVPSGAVYPELRAGSRRALWIAIAVLVIGLGAGGGYLIASSGDDVKPAPIARDRPAVEMSSNPADPAGGSATGSGVPRPTPGHDGLKPGMPDPRPNPQEAGSGVARPTTGQVAVPPTIPDPKPTVPEAPTGVPRPTAGHPDPRPTVPEPARPVAHPPVTHPQVTPVHKPPPVTHPVPPPPPKPKPDPKPDPKDGSWDPNSPFLPH